MSNKLVKKFLISFTKKFLPDSIFLFVKKQYYKFNKKLFSPGNEPELSILKKIINRNDSVIDVGANIGVFTKNLADLVGKEGLVIGIEPIPFTYEVLKSNMKYFGLKNVKLYNCAVSAKNGKVTMIVPSSEFGTDNFYEARISPSLGNSGNTLQIDAITLDGLSENIGAKISFVKIDVEGHELDCIKGAKNFLIKNKPLLLIEVSGDPDDSSSTSFELFKILAELGYSPYTCNGKTFKKRIYNTQSINYFFFAEKHISKFPGLIS